MAFESFRLGDLVEELTVGHVGSMASEYVASGVPFLRSLNVIPYRISMEDIRYIEPAFHKKLRKSSLRPGDVVIVRTGKPGTCAVIPEWLSEANCSDLVIARTTSRLYPKYLAYWVNAMAANHVSGHLVGAVQQHFNVGAARELPILLPSIPEQSRILNILSSLDDKIELNRGMNETLEAMAQAIFRDWFVDFGPTRRKLEGASDPVAIMGGLVQDADRARAFADLFPATLGDNGLPEGWQTKGLDEIADFLNGLALQKYPATDKEDSLPVIKIAELRSGITSKSGRASRSVPKKYIVSDGDFIFSWSGSLLAKFWTRGEGALNQHLFKVSSATYPSWFFSQWVHHHLPDFQRIAASKATTMGHIQRSHLSGAITVCPSAPTVEGLGTVFKPLVERTVHNELENRTLAATRDLLLPKLMSGEIRLSEAEDLVEAAQ